MTSHRFHRVATRSSVDPGPREALPLRLRTVEEFSERHRLRRCQTTVDGDEAGGLHDDDDTDVSVEHRNDEAVPFLEER